MKNDIMVTMKLRKKFWLFFIMGLFLLGVFWVRPLSVKRLIAQSYAHFQAAILPLTLKKEMNTKLEVPFHKQERPLSCEIAALRMALNYYGWRVSEDELLARLPFETHSSRLPGNIWGDPDRGFVGDINGRMPNSGYGVYENPIALIASQYREAQALSGTSLTTILEQVAAGRPVIVWGHIASGKDISWQTPGGKEVKAVFGEHARVVAGFIGTVSEPKYLILLDPIYGKMIWSADKFLQNWASLDNRAVVVY